MGYSSDTKTSQHEFQWDLSKSRNPADIGWPAAVNPSDPYGQDYFSVYPKGRVLIRFPEGRKFDGYPLSVNFGKRDGRINLVDIELPQEAAEQIYLKALSITHEWGLPTKRLDGWIALVRAGGEGTTLTARNDLNPAPSLEIVYGFGVGPRPYAISLEVYWGHQSP